MKLTQAAAIAVVLLSLASVASAQDAIIEGPGVKVGEGTVLHPSVGAETGVINNVFFEEDDPVTSPVLRLLASFDLATLPPERLETESVEAETTPPAGAPPKMVFRAGLDLTYWEYLSSRDQVRAQRDLEVGADVKLTAFPQGTVRFDLEDNFMRVIRPTNFESSQSLDRDINRFKTGLTFQPGGRSLTAGARYENRLDLFESDQSRFANRIQHTLGARVEWRLLPVTKFYFDGTYGFYRSVENDGTLADFKQDSNPLRLQLGAASVITPNVTARVTAGFGKGFYDAGPDYTGPIGSAELGYRYSPFGRLLARYEYDFQDSINANYFAEHAFKLRVDQQIQRVLLRAGLDARLRGYRGVPAAINPADPSRDDVIFAAVLEARYVFGDRYALTGDYRFVTDQTDFVSMTGGTADDPSYTRHEVWVGARAAF